MLRQSQATDSVVILGGSGFVGSVIADQLSLQTRLMPFVLSRSETSASHKHKSLICDAKDAAGLKDAISGCRFIVNCLAGDALTMLAGAKNLCSIAREFGVEKLIHISSMAVYGEAVGLVGEETGPVGFLSKYGRAKLDCERIVKRFSDEGGNAVILRPGCVYGPGGRQWTTQVGRLLLQGRIGDLGSSGDGICNSIFVEDVAGAVIAALKQPLRSGDAFNLGDAYPCSWNNYFSDFAKLIGASPLGRPSPARLKCEELISFPLRAMHLINARAGGHMRLPEPISTATLSLWRQRITLDHRKADAILSFARTPLERGLEKAAKWFNESSASKRR